MFGFYVINAVKEMTVAEFIFCGLIHCTEFAYQKQLFFQKNDGPKGFKQYEYGTYHNAVVS